jgi:hypothetical protein
MYGVAVAEDCNNNEQRSRTVKLLADHRLETSRRNAGTRQPEQLFTAAVGDASTKLSSVGSSTCRAPRGGLLGLYQASRASRVDAGAEPVRPNHQETWPW